MYQWKVSGNQQRINLWVLPVINAVLAEEGLAATQEWLHWILREFALGLERPETQWMGSQDQEEES